MTCPVPRSQAESSNAITKRWPCRNDAHINGYKKLNLKYSSPWVRMNNARGDRQRCKEYENLSASLLGFYFRGRPGQWEVAVKPSNCGPETKLRTQQKNSSPYQEMIQTEIFITWDWKTKKEWLSICGRGCRTRKVETTSASKVFFSSKCLADVLDSVNLEGFQ